MTEEEGARGGLQKVKKVQGREKKGAKPLSPAAVSRRLFRIAKAAKELYQELKALERTLPAPTPAEFEEMRKGRQPLTLGALLIGVVGKVAFYLSEVSDTVEDYRPYSEQGAAASSRPLWERDLEASIKWAVELRARVGSVESCGKSAK